MNCLKNEVIRISAAEAADDFASLLDRVRDGVEIVIGEGSKPVAVVRPVVPQGGRLLSESIALAEAHAKDLGYTPTMGPDFANDLQEIINSYRKPLDPPAWD
jgi:prevent-host-death family protein